MTDSTTMRARPRRPRRMPFAALLSTLTIVVAGCSGAEPAPTASSSSAPTAAPSATTATPAPTPSGPDIPAAARTQDEEGGVAFVKFFIDQVNESYTTPRDDLIPALSHPDCKSCADLQDTASKFVATKSHTSNPLYSVSNERWVGELQPEVFLVTVTLTQLPVKNIDSAGVAVHTYERQPSNLRVGINWREGQWVIFDTATQ